MKYLDEWQHHIKELTVRILGEHVMKSPQERALRCFEELAEACQALDVPCELLVEQLHNTYARPKEEHVDREIGGTLYTLLALAESLDMSAYRLMIETYDKCSSPEIQQRMRMRQSEKLHPAGFKP
jgi:hypothetical protein